VDAILLFIFILILTSHEEEVATTIVIDKKAMYDIDSNQRETNDAISIVLL